ncbi:MAG: hypothetical protein ACR9NN_12075 [Nostochopsis sp.]
MKSSVSAIRPLNKFSVLESYRALAVNTVSDAAVLNPTFRTLKCHTTNFGRLRILGWRSPSQVYRALYKIQLLSLVKT